jgi:hypothetical protein
MRRFFKGFNDLISVFLSLFLFETIGPEWQDAQPPPQSQLFEMEGESFWALAKLIDGMQDVYTNDRRGLFRMMATISSVVQR